MTNLPPLSAMPEGYTFDLPGLARSRPVRVRLTGVRRARRRLRTAEFTLAFIARCIRFVGWIGGLKVVTIEVLD